MTFKGFWRWVGVGALASAAVLGSACGVAPQTAGRDPHAPRMNFFGGVLDTPEATAQRQLSTNRGFNGTIAQLGSSIDPRTRETEGVPGRSLPYDLAWRQVSTPGRLAARTGELSGGMGGSGGGGTQGPMYRERMREDEARPGQPHRFLDRMEGAADVGPRSGPGPGNGTSH